MTPIERYQHLYNYWNNEVKDRYKEWDDACGNRAKFFNKLAKAQIAEQMAKEAE